MKMVKVLYLSYDGMTDPLGQSQVIPYLIRLRDRGYRFTIVSFEKENNYQENRSTIKTILDQNDIDWVPLKYHKFPPVLSTLFDLWMGDSKSNRLFREESFDIVHCRSYLSALIGLRLKKRFSVKFLFDMRGFWADERIEGGIWSFKNPVYRFVYHYFKRKEQAFLEQADCTVSLTEDGRRQIHSWNYIRNNPVSIKVIPCCADFNHFNRKLTDSTMRLKLQNRLGLDPDSLVLLYLGSLGTWYMLDEMLNFFKVLLTYRPDAKFLFITKDSTELISEATDKKHISFDKIIVKAAERNEIPDLISLAHLSIFFIKPVFSKKASSPTKQGELMGMGIPIVCNAGVGDTAEIIQNTSSGAVIANLTEASYREVCDDLERLLAISPEQIRVGGQRYYSLQRGVDAYEEIYENLV